MRHKTLYFLIALLFGSSFALPAMATGPYDASAVMFAQMMIPHHTQAILISRLALKQSDNSAVKQLAQKIISEQAPEIVQMKKWIPANTKSGMEMGMQGMLTQSDLNTLRAARGKKFDGLFLVDMTLHHQGAIAMASALTKSKNPEVAALCKGIVSGQRAEIKRMRQIIMTGK